MVEKIEYQNKPDKISESYIHDETYSLPTGMAETRKNKSRINLVSAD
jgi:hypothetical protein